MFSFHPNQIHMLESLRDIEIASTIMKGGGEEDEDPLETHYRRLQCQLAPLPKDSTEVGMIESYLLKTHAPTHKVACRETGGERNVF